MGSCVLLILQTRVARVKRYFLVIFSRNFWPFSCFHCSLLDAVDGLSPAYGRLVLLPSGTAPRRVWLWIWAKIPTSVGCVMRPSHAVGKTKSKQYFWWLSQWNIHFTPSEHEIDNYKYVYTFIGVYIYVPISKELKKISEKYLLNLQLQTEGFKILTVLK